MPAVIEKNGRTHEPSLRELCAELDGLRNLIDERDRRYTSDRDSDRGRVDHAFTAAEKASDRATLVSNEFRGQLKDQADTFFSKEEAKARLSGIEQRITELAARLDRGEGRSGGVESAAEWVTKLIPIGIAVIALWLGVTHH